MGVRSWRWGLLYLIIFLVTMSEGTNSLVHAEEKKFIQGEGFQQGAYDLYAEQPTSHNWSRQSVYRGPVKPVLNWSKKINTVNSRSSVSPVIGNDGTVYLGSDDNNLYAYSPEGEIKWSFKTNGWIESSAAIGANGTIYVSSDRGTIYALNPDGSEKWTFQTDYYDANSITIGADGTLYTSTYEHVYAIHPDGTKKWDFKEPGAKFADLVISKEGLIILGSVNKLYAINQEGKLAWHFETSGDILNAPNMGEAGTIYLGTTNGILYALHPDGTERFKVSLGGRINGSPAIDRDGNIYVNSSNGTFYSVAEDGTIRWTYSSNLIFNPISPIIDVEGNIYTMSYNRLIALNTEGKSLWTFEWGKGSTSAPPALGANGLMYIASDGYLNAIGLTVGNLDLEMVNGSTAIGEINDYKVTATYSDGLTEDITDKVTLAFSDPHIAKVWTPGEIIGLAEGDTQIQVDYFNRSISMDIQISSTYITGIELNHEELNMKEGESHQIEVYALYSNGLRQHKGKGVVYHSTNPKAIIVRSDGRLVGIDEGISTISVTYGMNKKEMLVQTSGKSLAFDPNWVDGQFLVGNYDRNAVQPIAFNWTRQTKMTGPDNPELLWKHKVGPGGPGESSNIASPVIAADGTVYINSKPGLYAVSPYGVEKWRLPIIDDTYSSPVIGSDGTIYYTTLNKKLHAVDPNGQLKWSIELDSGLFSSFPIGNEGILYIGTSSGSLYSIYPDGTIKWRISLNEDIYSSSPVISQNGDIYVRTSSTLYGISPEGEIKWTFENGGSNDAVTPLISNGKIYTYSRDGNLYALNLDGTQQNNWRKSFVNASSSPVMGVDGIIYICGVSYQTNDAINAKVVHTLYAINPDGTIKWQVPIWSQPFINGSVTVHPIKSTPIIGLDGMIYLGSSNRHFYAITPEGQIKWSYEFPEDIYSSPALSHTGTIYFTANNGNLYALGDRIPVSDIVLDKEKLVLKIGEGSKTISSKITPDYATNQRITWASSNPGVASVSQNGTVTPVRGGISTITVTTEDGHIAKECTVLVLPFDSNGDQTIDLYDVVYTGKKDSKLVEDMISLYGGKIQ